MIFLPLPELLYVAERTLGPDYAVRDYGLLEAALARPKATAFGKDAYPDLDAKAAAKSPESAQEAPAFRHGEEWECINVHVRDPYRSIGYPVRVRTAYRCRAYPDEAQQQVLARTFGCVRVVWNRTLAARHARYATESKPTSYAQTDAALTAMKKTLARELSGENLCLAIVGPAGRAEPQVTAALHTVDPDGAWTTRKSNVTDTELDALYRGAWLLLQPSQSEGYGLPVGEAASMGLPALHSGGGALSEIAPRAVPSPDDPGSYATEICSMLAPHAYSEAASASIAAARQHTRARFTATIAQALAVPAAGEG